MYLLFIFCLVLLLSQHYDTWQISITNILHLRLWHRCGEGCSSGSSLPVCEPCDPAYGVCGPREPQSIGPGNVVGPNQSQTYQGTGEGETNTQPTLSSIASRPPAIPSLIDNVPGGAQIQRGGSLPNPVVSSALSSNQSGPGGRASSLSSSQASRASTAPVSHTNTSSAFSALIWKMNERGPTGIHTPAALASLAELLANPAGVPGSQPTNIASNLDLNAISGGISVQKLNINETNNSLERKYENKSEVQTAKV